jgi:DNA-binding CsgD family transcriptional regulator
VAALQTASRQWQELHVPYEAATAMTLLGQAQTAARNDDAAKVFFANARALFEQIGANLDARGIDSTRRTRRPSGLTEREVEVLDLIAAGWANKEIAAQLRLSAKTVSRHLTNIFNKIGVTSRAAATAYAFEHHLVSRHPRKPDGSPLPRKNVTKTHQPAPLTPWREQCRARPDDGASLRPPPPG